MLVSELQNNLSVREVGGKGYSLRVLIENAFDVPNGFVIASEAFFEHLKQNNLIRKIEKLTSEIDEDNFRGKSNQIRNLILGGKISQNITQEIKENLDKLNVPYVSIRSSAVSEDSIKASFAGMHDTFLNIKSEPSLVLNCVKKCLASLFNTRAVVYRIRKNMPHLEGMAVIIQKMIPADVSGITFTVHPLNKKALLIETSCGLGDIIVSGKIEPDEYVISRETLRIVNKRLGNKNKISICQDGGTEVINIKDKKRQAISDERIKEIAKICLNVEELFNYPQDIEWCVSNNRVWLLQSRAITEVIDERK